MEYTDWSTLILVLEDENIIRTNYLELTDSISLAIIHTLEIIKL